MSLQAQYNSYQATIRSLQSRQQELSSQLQEHDVVISTLAETDPSRKAYYSLPDGTLLSTTAKEAHDKLTIIAKNLTEVIKKVELETKETSVEFESWKKEKNIKIVSS
ncbi:tubulin-binding prefolding complex subunit [Martiniozyma asiatica (nom. inval.)]|nr:tubulin-binding prefolding complex subunit [Martiniozyma asiatica]